MGHEPNYWLGPARRCDPAAHCTNDHLQCGSRVFDRHAFPGDFELTEMGVAVASFAFLPYCQLTFANVSADVFTAKMSPCKVRILSRVGSLVAAAFSILLLWRMYEGLLDYQMYLETTTILQIPIWFAFLPALFSLLLLLLSSLITFVHPDGVPETTLTS